MRGICYKCVWCGNSILSPNRLKKYCSDECAKEAHRSKCRERFRERYAENPEAELARARRYWEKNADKRKAYFREYQRRRKEQTLCG